MLSIYSDAGRGPFSPQLSVPYGLQPRQTTLCYLIKVPRYFYQGFLWQSLMVLGGFALEEFSSLTLVMFEAVLASEWYCFYCYLHSQIHR